VSFDVGENKMSKDIRISKNKRFLLDSQGNILDKAHPEYRPETPVHMNQYTNKPLGDELHLRIGVLVRRLERLVPELVQGNGAKRERKALSSELPHILADITQASQLNVQDVQVSLQNPFKGRLKHRKTELCELTSISLFVDDVERLLRDLYGHANSDPLNDLIRAIRSTTLTISSHLLPDLGAEHEAAFCVDRGAGRGLLPGEGVSTRMVRDGIEAAEMLIGRARTVLSSQSEYGRYTVGFAKALNEYWPAVEQWRPLARSIPEAIAKLQMRCKYVNAVVQ
jgi:hypothetical protein